MRYMQVQYSSSDNSYLEMSKQSCSIIVGNALEELSKFPENFFQCCVTSPPYWGLRDYGIDGQIGAEMSLDDYIGKLVLIFSKVRRTLTDNGTLWLNIGDSYTSGNRT
jgi:site-specific DNA-methyltransferase (cytosine-N4-specific)